MALSEKANIVIENIYDIQELVEEIETIKSNIEKNKTIRYVEIKCQFEGFEIKDDALIKKISKVIDTHFNERLPKIESEIENLLK